MNESEDPQSALTVEQWFSKDQVVQGPLYFQIFKYCQNLVVVKEEGEKRFQNTVEFNVHF